MRTAGLIIGLIALAVFYLAFISPALTPPIIDEYVVTTWALWVSQGLAPYVDFNAFHFPGYFQLLAALFHFTGASMAAARITQALFAFLLAAAVFRWARLSGLERMSALAIAFLPLGPLVYLWPIITPHIPAMAFYAWGCVLVRGGEGARGREGEGVRGRRGEHPVPSSEYRVASEEQSGLLGTRNSELVTCDRPTSIVHGQTMLVSALAGVCFVMCGWFVQTMGVLACVTVIAALVRRVGSHAPANHRRGVMAGVGIAMTLVAGSLAWFGSWAPFWEQAVRFVLSGYRQAGGINDPKLWNEIVWRAGHEPTIAGVALVMLLTLAVFMTLFGVPLWMIIRRRFVASGAPAVAALAAPIVYLLGRHDIHHAAYLTIPALFWLCDSPKPAFERACRYLGGVCAVLMLLAVAPYLPHLHGWSLSRPPAMESAAVQTIRSVVPPGEPVAVLPWAANLYFHGIEPGHRIPFVGHPDARYHVGREWEQIHAFMDDHNVSRLAFYPASSRKLFVPTDSWPEYLLRSGKPPELIWQGGAVEIWQYKVDSGQ